MTLFLTVLHVVVCLLLIGVVLLQRGKGAEIGAVFGGGGGSTVFGSRGAGNFLTRLTTGAAVVFMATSLILAYFARDSAESTLFEEDATTPAAQSSPFEEAGEPAPAEAPAQDASPFEEVTPPAAEEAPAAETSRAPAAETSGAPAGEASEAPAGERAGGGAPAEPAAP